MAQLDQDSYVLSSFIQSHTFSGHPSEDIRMLLFPCRLVYTIRQLAPTKELDILYLAIFSILFQLQLSFLFINNYSKIFSAVCVKCLIIISVVIHSELAKSCTNLHCL